jgi:hypothetical protein
LTRKGFEEYIAVLKLIKSFIFLEGVYMNWASKFLFALMAVVLVSSFAAQPAHAYVDPGIIASLYQVLYVAIFGIAAGVVVKPFKMMQRLIARIREMLGAQK